MIKDISCPKCHFSTRFDRIQLVSGGDKSVSFVTHSYIQLYCQCSNEPVLQFVVDLAPEFDRTNTSNDKTMEPTNG